MEVMIGYRLVIRVILIQEVTILKKRSKPGLKLMIKILHQENRRSTNKVVLLGGLIFTCMVAIFM